MTASCLFLNTFYDGFLATMYADATLASASYASQHSALLAANFGDSDFYSAGLQRAGWQAEDVVVNALPLQLAWATENGVPTTVQGQPLSGIEVAAEQVARTRPDVVYVQDLNNTPAAFLDAIRPFVKIVCGQIATPVVGRVPFDRYDVLISSFPHYVAKFREVGLCAYYQPLAFSETVLDAVGNPAWNGRKTDCSFVGGISRLHIEGNQLLEDLAQKTPTQFWGYGAEHLAPSSAIAPRHGGPAWGNDMFRRLADSRITINRHGEIADRFANNMRLFEATGCGALLITDHKDNLDDLFVVGEEVVAYRSREECVSLVSYFLDHPEQAEKIARAGQARTRRDHSYARRMEHTAEILERHLRYGSERHAAIDARTVSVGHRQIAPQEVTEAQRDAWKSAVIPAKQRALVQQELANMYRGSCPEPFMMLANALQPWLRPDERLVEIGCASGYYFEVLEYLMGQRIDYVGVDYSEALIEMARDYYPGARFEVADAADLPFDDMSFVVALSGGVLLHMTEWRAAVAETARVAERAAVFYRTPVCRRGPTRVMSKLAYGVETVELVFSEQELAEAFVDNGLILRSADTYAADEAGDIYHVNYVCQKGPSA